MSTKDTAGERARRLLAIIPWVIEHGSPTVDEVCERFDVGREQLLADLDVVFFVGVHPFSPDEMIDVELDGERVRIRLAEWFRRPLRLTPTQGLSLVAAARSALAMPGADPDGPLARGLRKLEAALGLEAESGVEVDLGAVERATLGALNEAIERNRVVEIDYWSDTHQEQTTRAVEPGRVLIRQGAWYLAAYCRSALGERVFRIDRIRRTRVLDEVFQPRSEEPTLSIYQPRDSDPRAVLDLGPEARWVVEQYPVERVEELADGGLRATMAVSSLPWFGRLLLRLGPGASVVAVSGDSAVGEAGRDAARRVLDRYRPAAGEAPAT